MEVVATSEVPQQEQTLGFMLNEYLSNFKPQMAEEIYATIIKTRVLKNALDKPEGKILLEGPIREITKNVSAMIEMLVKGDVMEGDKDKLLKTYALAAKVRWEYLTSLATIVVEGEKHIKAATKTRKKRS